MSIAREPLLRVEDLRVSFRSDDGLVRAVRGVSFEVYPGETVGIVGESGSGKSVTNLALMGLVPQPPGVVDGGRALYQGQDLLAMSEAQLQRIRGNRIAMIFQDPMTALNPLLTVEDQLTEVARRHLKLSRADAIKRAVRMLGDVGISAPERRLDDYPHEFSGGMRQRVMIAMALMCEPDILIADEPTTALDVTIQAQILELLRALQQQRGTAIILITHDLGVVASVCHRVLVMYAGRIVEKAPAVELFATPHHPYTLGLLGSVPRWDAGGSELLQAIPGQPPDLAHLPTGCPFHPRCAFAEDQCRREDPPLESVPDSPEHKKACWVPLPTAAAP